MEVAALAAAENGQIGQAGQGTATWLSACVTRMSQGLLGDPPFATKVGNYVMASH